MACTDHCAQALIEIGSLFFVLPRLALNCDPSALCLSSSLHYRLEPLYQLTDGFLNSKLTISFPWWKCLMSCPLPVRSKSKSLLSFAVLLAFLPNFTHLLLFFALYSRHYSHKSPTWPSTLNLDCWRLRPMHTWGPLPEKIPSLSVCTLHMGSLLHLLRPAWMPIPHGTPACFPGMSHLSNSLLLFLFIVTITINQYVGFPNNS
jgi:hypothetical protein